jgi:hypothetical protein
MDLTTDLPTTLLGCDFVYVCEDHLSKMIHRKAIH